MSADTDPTPRSARQAALDTVTESAARNIPGADFVSITVRKRHDRLVTLTATDSLALQADSLQYELHEGPCYAAVTDERFVLVNDMATSVQFPRYGPEAVRLGIGAQAGIQLLHNGETAGLNLYARTAEAFDSATVQIAELFATHAGALLGYATQVEQLNEALHTRTDIGMAVGILMERYRIDRHQAFAFLARNSSRRNIKLRLVAKEVVERTFQSSSREDNAAQDWP
jgi:hypothetical protein